MATRVFIYANYNTSRQTVRQTEVINPFELRQKLLKTVKNGNFDKFDF